MRRSHIYYELLILGTTMALLIYTAVVGYLSIEAREGLRGFDGEDEWLAIETENPYSLLNSRFICKVLAPMFLGLSLLNSASSGTTSSEGARGARISDPVAIASSLGLR